MVKGSQVEILALQVNQGEHAASSATGQSLITYGGITRNALTMEARRERM